MKPKQVIKLRNLQDDPTYDVLVGRKYRPDYTVSRIVSSLSHLKGKMREQQPRSLTVVDDQLTEESRKYINNLVSGISNWRPNEFVLPSDDVYSPVIFSQSMRDFIYSKRHESRIAKLIYNLTSSYRSWYNYRHIPNHNLTRLILTAEEINYITFRNNGMISYMPSNKVQQFRETGEWLREGRQEGKPAKVIRKIFTKKAQAMFTTKDYEVFNNLYQSQYNTENLVFKVEPKDRIGEVYEYEVEESKHTLGGSCMRGQRDYMRLYERAKDCMGIVVCHHKITNEFLGRALLWNVTRVDSDGQPIYKIDESGTRVLEKFTFMDRVYSTSDQTAHAFIDYAKSQGWYSKVKFQSRSDCNFLQAPHEGENITRFMRVDADQDNLDYYPYIDTFQNGDCNYLYNTNVGDYEYDSTGGDRTFNGESDEETWTDEITGETYDSDDNLVTVEGGRYRGCLTHRDNTLCVYGRYYWREDDLIVTDINGDHQLHEDCVWSNRHEEYILINDAYHIESIDDYVLEDECAFDKETSKYILI